MSHKLLYVAGPYSGDIKNNIQRAEEVSIDLIRNGFHVITPHKNCAGYEKYEDKNINHSTWIDMDNDLISRCDAIYVMENYEKSLGTRNEIDYGIALKLPIIYAQDYPPYNFTLRKYYKLRDLHTFKL